MLKIMGVVSKAMSGTRLFPFASSYYFLVCLVCAILSYISPVLKLAMKRDMSRFMKLHSSLPLYTACSSRIHECWASMKAGTRLNFGSCL